MNENSPWKTIQFEDMANALDVDFIDNKNGFLVGSNRLIMESNDGGETWEKRNLDLPSEENFRLLDIDFKGEEGWLIGQPSLVLLKSLTPPEPDASTTFAFHDSPLSDVS